ncbi:ABC transporter ATP-binding protein [Advenella mimigardefordensis]|uniref:Putative dipeptide ABC transporter ATP-binding protein n=1 Tax=Advenella mimigardefordensis (strain DSM 17166 / LMG 22922 / DPN7) TaxID=1247726 RepID=W0PGD2_ADVMD|nr:ABC transporter ATP-binding protein [Advenella mimigardefordensis]AHG66139.1 putative dipeptide ABC transporter ATP-binding protein [Advenella mimigardefordensis DPN7]
MDATPLLEVNHLQLETRQGGKRVVDDIGFAIMRGEIVGIVGESGSGKSMTARAVMRLEPPAIKRVEGRIAFDGQDVTAMPSKRLHQLRGAKVGMVFQEPMTSLNPSMTIGRQLDEGLALHSDHTAVRRRELTVQMLSRIGIQDPEKSLTAYPHHFSGGMRQRIMLAAVMLVKPELLIADEPTTALDAIVQRDVLELMVELTREQQTAVLLISHDLPMVARYTDKVIVMEHGRIVEQGPTADIIAAPRHPYTRKLLSSLPVRGQARKIDRTVTPVVEAKNIVVDYPGRGALFRKSQGVRALHGIDLQIHAREVLALVGGSGSGKTTLGWTIAGLLRQTDGHLAFDGEPVDRASSSWQRYRHDCQMVFQDPYSSLDPRMTVRKLVEESLRSVPQMEHRARNRRIDEVLDEVGLPAQEYADRYPNALSGGQRQRIAIARALSRRPKFVIADEPVSALDVTVRAQILSLFSELQKHYGFSCLFISHDLAVVEQVADRVAVMQKGRIVEQGSRDAIFDAPQHAYTRELLSAIPLLETTPSGGVQTRWRFQSKQSRNDV